MSVARSPFLEEIGHECAPGCRPGSYHWLTVDGRGQMFSQETIDDAPYLRELWRRALERLEADARSIA